MCFAYMQDGISDAACRHLLTTNWLTTSWQNIMDWNSVFPIVPNATMSNALDDTWKCCRHVRKLWRRFLARKFTIDAQRDPHLPNPKWKKKRACWKALAFEYVYLDRACSHLPWNHSTTVLYWFGAFVKHRTIFQILKPAANHILCRSGL